VAWPPCGDFVLQHFVLWLNSSDGDEATAAEPHRGFQSESGLGGLERGQEAGRSGAAV